MDGLLQDPGLRVLRVASGLPVYNGRVDYRADLIHVGGLLMG